MTSDDLKAELKLRMGGRSDISSRLEDWINAAYTQIATKFKFRELESSQQMVTINGARVYSTPPLVFVIMTVRDITNNRLLSPKYITELERVAATPGKPYRWARWGHTLTLDPTPNGEYLIEVKMLKRPTLLTFPGTGLVNHVLPTEWEEGILRKAKSVAYTALLEPTKAADAATLYKDWLSELTEVEVIEESYLMQTIGVRR